MRIRRRVDTDEKLASSSRVFMDPKRYKGRWHEAFEQSAPLHVELGMGKGQFISQMSFHYPNVNFIGIDMYDELVRKAIDKAETIHGVQNPANLALVRADINQIGDFFADDEVSRIYLNHSDPWPKKRHEHRRLTHPRFMEQYLRILKQDGEIHLKTDSLSLFEYSLNVFAQMQLPMQNISLDVHREGTPPEYIFTEYEQKFMQRGDRIYRVEVKNNRTCTPLPIIE